MVPLVPALEILVIEMQRPFDHAQPRSLGGGDVGNGDSSSVEPRLVCERIVVVKLVGQQQGHHKHHIQRSPRRFRSRVNSRHVT